MQKLYDSGANRVKDMLKELDRVQTRSMAAAAAEASNAAGAAQPPNAAGAAAAQPPKKTAVAEETREICRVAEDNNANDVYTEIFGPDPIHPSELIPEVRDAIDTRQPEMQEQGPVIEEVRDAIHTLTTATGKTFHIGRAFLVDLSRTPLIEWALFLTLFIPKMYTILDDRARYLIGSKKLLGVCGLMLVTMVYSMYTGAVAESWWLLAMCAVMYVVTTATEDDIEKTKAAVRWVLWMSLPIYIVMLVVLMPPEGGWLCPKRRKIPLVV